jgi:peptide/nickel transport system substrate-binding protein
LEAEPWSRKSTFGSSTVAPIVQVGLMSGYGPRVEESGLGLITGYSFAAPYEDVRLKGK